MNQVCAGLGGYFLLLSDTDMDVRAWAVPEPGTLSDHKPSSGKETEKASEAQGFVFPAELYWGGNCCGLNSTAGDISVKAAEGIPTGAAV